MPAKLSGGTAAAGVVAYADSEDPNTFHYFPINIAFILGETLKTFKVTYWGIGKPYYVKPRYSGIKSLIGMDLKGKAAFDISSYQRDEIKKAILISYGCTTPKLVPLALSGVEVQPVLGENSMGFSEDSLISFPKSLNVGDEFEFVVSTGSSLFAQFTAGHIDGTEIIPNPAIGINISGYADFIGDPWAVHVQTDLSEFWRRVRDLCGTSIEWGWTFLNLATLENLFYSLIEEKVIQVTILDGSLESKIYGRQILELMRLLFDEVNKLELEETMLFRLTPNPEPAVSLDPQGGLAWPWAVQINLGFGPRSTDKKPQTDFSAVYELSGLHRIPQPSSMTLMAGCNSATIDCFYDLGEQRNACISAKKAEETQLRLARQLEDRKRIARILYEQLQVGDISQYQYDWEMLKLSN